jgi:hypothetical protein
MVEPFRRIFTPSLPWNELGYYACGGVISIAVWALCGGAIARAAIVQLGLRRRVGLGDAFSFACRNWIALFGAPTLPLVGIVAIAIPFVVIGLLLRLDAGVALAGVLWAILLLPGLLMAMLSVGLMFGWPLMWGAVAADNTDAFDAISRSYAYTFQRPIHYLYYVLCASLLSVCGWLLAWWFVESIVALCYWGVSWGSGGERLLEIQQGMSGHRSEEMPFTFWLGARLIAFSVGLVRATASAFSFSYFWCAFAAIYLLLRRDTDQTELDDLDFTEYDESNADTDAELVGAA